MSTFQQLLQQSLGPKFVVEAQAGAGGMSTVFVAHDTALDRRVAVKVLSRDIAGAITLRRFELETRTLAGLQHPNIVPVLWTGDVDGLPYFVMPFINGETLRDRLERGRLTVRDTSHIARDVTRALAHAHIRGVVHRDIKPENILLTHDAAIVSDFGIAKAIDDAHVTTGAQSTSLTGAGLSLGTPRYMAPEQVAADPHIDHRADLYSLGVVLYEMLVGSPPFNAATRHAVLAAHLSETPKPLASLRPDVPAQLAAAIDKCLAKKPGDRFATADELLRAIENASGSIEVPRKTVPGRNRWPMVGAATLLGLVAVGTTFYLYSRRAGTTGTTPHSVPGLAVAILPIENASRSDEQEYLSDGVTAELSNNLTRIPGVRVVSATSVAYARGRHATLREMGAALGVGFIVENELTSARNRVRVATRMIHAARDSTMWSRSYEGDVSQLDSLQRSLSRDLALQLTSFAGVAAETTLASEPRRDPQAYDEYLRATHLVRQRRPESLQTAVLLLQSSIRRDPSFARAHAALARVYSLLPLYTGMPIDSVRAPAVAAVERALALDPRIADAYTSRAALLAADWRRLEAERDFTRAIAFDSSNVVAWQWRGEMYLVEGRVREAVHDLRKATALDPYSGIVNGSLAVALSHAGDRDAALEAARQAVAFDTLQPIPLIFLAAVQLERAEYREASATLARVLQIDASPLSVGLAGFAAARSGDRTRALDFLQRLERDSLRSGALVGAARIATATGDTARALSLLHAAADRHDPMFSTESLGSTMYDPIRSSPRFRSLMRKIGLDSLAHSRARR